MVFTYDASTPRKYLYTQRASHSLLAQQGAAVVVVTKASADASTKEARLAVIVGYGRHRQEARRVEVRCVATGEEASIRLELGSLNGFTFAQPDDDYDAAFARGKIVHFYRLRQPDIMAVDGGRWMADVLARAAIEKRLAAARLISRVAKAAACNPATELGRRVILRRGGFDPDMT